jgi:hypothetical protein
MKIKSKFLVGVLLLFDFSVSYSWTTAEVFAKYPNTYFVETGSCLGDGIQSALDAGFKHIYSIELSEKFYDCCFNRFVLNSGLERWVELVLGDSGEVLPEVLNKINGSATFWLDGHYSGGSTAKGKSNTPLIKELDHIAAHHINNHTILIDDVRYFGTADFDFLTLGEVMEKILSINPLYEFSFEDGYIENDVLVVRIPGSENS